MQHNDLEVAKAKQVAKELGQGQDGKTPQNASCVRNAIRNVS